MYNVFKFFYSAIFINNVLKTQNLAQTMHINDVFGKEQKMKKKTILKDFFFFIGQVLDLPNTGNHTQHITCTIRLEIALS